MLGVNCLARWVVINQWCRPGHQAKVHADRFMSKDWADSSSPFFLPKRFFDHLFF
jgi:hypothetical protein